MTLDLPATPQTPTIDTSLPPFVLVDGSYYLFRTFHGLPPLTTSKGLYTNAIKGTLNSLQKLMRRYQPTHMAVVFDTAEPTFRHELSVDYKAHRPKMPDELSEQIPYIHALIRALGIPLLTLPGAEADDLIGTLATRACREGHHVLISTGDKDMAQLVHGHILLEDSFKDQLMDHRGVIEKFGVRPDQIRDYLTLMGDASDGIAGIPKIGAKTASKLLQQYDTIGGILENIDQIKGAVGQSLRDNADQIPLNHQLASIVCDLPLELDWHELKLGESRTDELRRLYTELEFKGLLQSLDHPNHPDRLARQNSSVTAPTQTLPLPASVLASAQPTATEANAHLTVASRYHTVQDNASLIALIDRLQSAERFAIDTETTHLDWRSARVVGISVALAAGEAWYVPFGHDYPDAPTQLSEAEVLAAFKPLLENPAIGKIGHHLKYDTHVLSHHGIRVQGWIFDTMLASYVLNTTATRHGLGDLALHYLQRSSTSFEDVAGKGAKQLTFNQVTLEKAAPYACEDADLTWQLYELLTTKLAEHPVLAGLLTDLELPVAQILETMESHGIALDIDFLNGLGKQFGEEMLAIEARAHEQAGETFNVASPKQLGEILFERLGLAGGKKTATGQYATGEAVLEKLDHPLAATVLDYRSLSKLKSTYTDRLTEQADPITHRVHTSYHQANTATGRLSSSDPNLQNIPIRTETGRLIRKAFIAPPGKLLMAADYSQIELRLMAHFSQDAALVNAFRHDLDIHRATAAEVMGIPLDQVTSEQRRQAKAINFGLLYGMSSFGLAKQLGLGRTEAQEYITLYFARYPGVLDYMKRTRALAATQGYVETLFGRRLYTPDVQARNAVLRQAAERAAINAPLQGTAADIIKRAMIEVQRVLPPECRMLLQVHDELVFEVPETLESQMRELLKEHMTAPCVAVLSVPLRVEVGSGKNWDDAH